MITFVTPIGCKKIFTMVNSAEFAQRLQEMLNYYGLSATAFSDAIDFNRSTISHLLSGRNKPSLEFVLKVLEKFPEVELYWLMNSKGTFPSSTGKSEQLFQGNENDLPQDLLNQEEGKFTEAPAYSNKKDEIDRIVIFFKNGHFKSYS